MRDDRKSENFSRMEETLSETTDNQDLWRVVTEDRGIRPLHDHKPFPTYVPTPPSADDLDGLTVLEDRLSIMSDGATHDRHGLLMATLVALGVAISWWRGAAADIWCLPAGILLGTHLLSPDLDMWNTRPMKRWGPLRFFWTPGSTTIEGPATPGCLGPLCGSLYPSRCRSVCCGGHSTRRPRRWGLWCAWLIGGVYVGNWLHLAGDRRWPRLPWL